jgi:hypothetical protein
MTRYFVGPDHYAKGGVFLGIKTENCLVSQYYDDFVQDTLQFNKITGLYKPSHKEAFFEFIVQALQLTEIHEDLIKKFLDQYKELTYVQFGIGAKPQ